MAYNRREAQLKAIREALRAHGSPLHWEVLAAIVTAKHPALFQSTRSVSRLLSWNHEEFESEGDGVYRLVAN